MFSGGRAGRNQVTRHCLPACAPRGVAIGADVCLASFMAGRLLSSLSLCEANRRFYKRSFLDAKSERFESDHLTCLSLCVFAPWRERLLLGLHGGGVTQRRQGAKI